MAQVHATFETIGERSLPAPASMDLRLDHEVGRGELTRDFSASSGVRAALPAGVATSNFSSNSFA